MYWELTPWCQIIPYPGHAYDAANTSSVLEKTFEGFAVDQVQLPTNTETRRHEYFSNTLKLRTVAELKIVSGRDMYLIHLCSLSDDLSEKLGDFRFSIWNTGEDSSEWPRIYCLALE
jgi:hypothetical protein